MSLNAGLDWKLIANGSHVYQIADQGGLIVMADDSMPTKFIKFSWDLGERWETMQITEEALLVTSITVEPSTRGLVVLIYGISHFETSLGFIVPISFEKLLPRECK